MSPCYKQLSDIFQEVQCYKASFCCLFFLGYHGRCQDPTNGKFPFTWNSKKNDFLKGCFFTLSVDQIDGAEVESTLILSGLSLQCLLYSLYLGPGSAKMSELLFRLHKLVQESSLKLTTLCILSNVVICSSQMSEK